MFSGQGAQYVNMGLELYRTESIFREEVDRCSEILKPHLSLDLRDILYPEERNGEGAAEELKQTLMTQPALFVIEYALARLWMSWGVHPTALIGHSIGEYVAACLAGVFSLEDALALVAARGRLMQQQPAGSMLAVQLSEKDIEGFLNQRLSLAAVNAPAFCVVSGETEAVKQLESDLEKSNVAFTPLHTSHAFHSKMMEPIVDPFKEQVGQTRVSPPQIPFVSNLTGTWITSEEATNPSYWAKHLRQTVRFSDGIQELLKEPHRVFLEVGPGQTLSMLARQHSDGSKGRVVLSSIRHPKEQKSDIAFILSTLGRLWLAGVEVDWSGFYKNERRHRIPLPTYPFERQRYWIEPVEQPRGFFAVQAGLDKWKDDFQRSSKVQLGSDYLTPKGPELKSDYMIPRNPEFKNDYVPPRNKVERAMCDIWQKLLGIKQIGVHDNFFELGGSSLMAVRLFSQIEKLFGHKLPPTLLYEAQTVGQLSKLLSDTPSICDHDSDTAIPYTIIPANLLENKQDIIALWKRNFQSVKEERYVWIYENNPLGPATCLLAKDMKQDSIVGATATFPRRVLINGKYYTAGLGGDFAVNKEHRVLAPALLLQNAAISNCNEGKFDFLYGFLNKESEAVNLMLGHKMFDVLRMTKPLRSYYYLEKNLNFRAVAKMISKPIDLAIKIFSKETRYKRHDGLITEILSSFDGRFDKLWERVSTRFTIIGERSSSYLNWRYVRSPHNSHYIFALTGEDSRNLLGYIVFHIVKNRTNIDDILCLDMNETLDSLLPQFLLFQREEGIDSVSISYTGTQLFVKKLQEFGFSIRDKEGKVAIYVPSDSPVLSYVLEKENWYLMPGDNDICDI
jgi:malonyl CoA-acyl carrier protein transacylase